MDLLLPPPGFQLPGETGESYAENARIKARALCRATSEPAVGDDSGLEVDALGGRPGILSARYAQTDSERIERLLAELDPTREEGRAADFRCVLTLALPDGRTYSVEGVCRGVIARSPRGDLGFGYDPVFLPAGEARSFGEMEPEEKNRVSHRGLAARAFARMVGSL